MGEVRKAKLKLNFTDDFDVSSDSSYEEVLEKLLDAVDSDDVEVKVELEFTDGSELDLANDDEHDEEEGEDEGEDDEDEEDEDEENDEE